MTDTVEQIVGEWSAEREVARAMLPAALHLVSDWRDLLPLARAAIAALATRPDPSELMEAVSVEIRKGRQVVIDFEDQKAAFDLFNELQRRTAITKVEG